MWTTFFLATPELRTWLAWALALGWCGAAWTVARGVGRLPQWDREAAPEPQAAPPRVSLVVAARDEAARLEPALASWLAVRGVDEVVVVDDRSTDATPALLERWAAREPRIRALRLDTLPAGWLGKTYALARGAALATGDWLLFTDADVLLAPAAVERALAAAAAHDAGHLAGLIDIEMHTWRERIVMAVFRLHFHLGLRTWKAADPRSRAAIGVGGFHFMQRAAYDAAGGHQCVRLAVVDDVELAREVKARGVRSCVVVTGAVARVRWYDGVRDTVRGLTKNFFAGADYDPALCLAAAATMWTTHLGPFVLTLAPGGTVAARAASLAASLAQVAAYRAAGEPWLAGVLSPLGALVASFALLRSMALTLARGAVEWRETRYPLSMLRRFHADARLRRAGEWRDRQRAERARRRTARHAADGPVAPKRRES